MSSPYAQYQEIGWSSQTQLTPQEPAQTSWKFLAAVSSNLSLIGFLVIPLAFGDLEDIPPHVNKTATIIAAAILIAFAYALSLILIFFLNHERTFLIHSVFLPCLTSNIFALFNVVLNVLCRNLVPMGRLETLSMTVSAVFAFLYALGALWFYARDVNEGIRVESRRGTALLTEEELQRQQLSRLLERNSPRAMLSPKAKFQKTFRVNVPGRISTFIPPPQEEGYHS